MSSGDLSSTLGVSEQFKLLESLLQQLLHKDALTTPQLSEKKDIKSHLEKMSQYFKVCGIVTEETKIAVLFNTLTDDMRFELCGALEFEDHESDYSWIENKLLTMFSPKETEITPLVKLYSCKQGNAQPLKEFVSEIRIEGYKLLKNMDPKEREKHLIDAFTKGLHSEELRSALGRKEVTSLDDAYRLVKKEKISETDYIRSVEVNTQQNTDIQKLQNQMLMMQKTLTYIVTILEKNNPVINRETKRASYADVVQGKKVVAGEGVGQYYRRSQFKPFPRNQVRRPAIRCWTCGLEGHISRFCESNRRCVSCGLLGHNAQNCRSRRNPRKIRRIWEDEGNEDWPMESRDDDKMSNVSSEGSDVSIKNEISEICAITIHPRDENQERKLFITEGSKARKGKESKKKKYPDYIAELEEFIEGKRTKKKTCLTKEKEAIKDVHSENARNRPTVKGKCGGRQAKLFLDTGAEISVIDESFFENIKEPHNRRHKQDKIIKCANNTRMETKGWVRLDVQVGGLVRKCKFWIVRNLSPRVIIGIRAMKDMGVTVDPAKECAWVNGVRVPFLARVQPQSLHGSDSGNAVEPGLRVEGRR